MFHATEWGSFVRQDACVQGHHAVIQAFRHANHAADVTGVEVRSQAEFGVVGVAQHFFFGFKLEHRCQWAEGFVFGKLHFLGSACHDGRLEEQAAQSVRLTTCHNGSAFRSGVSNVFFHFFHGVGINHWAKIHACVHAITDRQFRYCGFEFFYELVVYAALYIQTVCAHASLTRIAEFANHRAFNRCVQIGIVEHDEWRVSAQFHRHFFHGRRTLFNQFATHFGRACEAEFFHAVVFGQHFADLARAAC